ncbi:hypothetical protein HDE_08608 [Halotydeus destructor]|nr:hypothetical protein HDE_08608 [Halotydeus destructor]
MKTFLLIAFSCALVGLTVSCTCMPPDAARDYCLSDFVGVVKVVSGPTDCEAYYHCYEVETIKVFKGRDVTTIKTGAQSSLCGRHFDVDSTQLINGRFYSDGGSLMTNACLHSEKWDLANAELIEERTKYFENVDCSGH